MELFSERNGLIKINKSNDYSSDFRNAIVTTFFNHYSTLEEGVLFHELKYIIDIFGIEQTPMLTDKRALQDHKEETLHYFQHCEWNQLFDFIELVLERVSKDKEELIEKYNLILRMHGCRYRIINDTTVPIISEIEAEEISKAANTGLGAVSVAIKEAINQLSNKNNPDYNAVISKASNALESMVLYVAEDKEIHEDTLGKALKRMQKSNLELDKDFIELMKKAYKYASNAGIRHGGTNPVMATESEAIYVLSICAASINYMQSNYKE